MPIRDALSLATCLVLASAAAAEGSGNVRDPQAVQEVLAGKRIEANAAWWGFEPDDATEALQAAIKSGARRVIVPNMKRDWIVRPLQLAGNQELVFEDGVVLTAKRGAYRRRNDTVLTAAQVDNLSIRGTGATVRMQKEDYIVGLVLKDLGWHRWFDQYEKAEWRSTLAIRGCNNVSVSGLTLRDSGGDGIYIAGGRGRSSCANVHIKDVVCDNHYRQGISIISVDGLVVEDTVFKNTWGTPPSAGVDIEPDSPKETVKGVVFRNCRFEDNYGDGIEVNLARLAATSDDVSILFDACYVTSRWGSGIRVTKINDDSPRGSVEFRDCVVEGLAAYGIKVQDKSADRARLRFVRCSVRDTAKDRNYLGAWAPIWLHRSSPQRVRQYGGIDFVDCTVTDDRERSSFAVTPELRRDGLFDVTGDIRVRTPDEHPVDLGGKSQGVSLAIKRIKP